MLLNQIHKISTKLVDIKTIELHWYPHRKQNRSKLIKKNSNYKLSHKMVRLMNK